MKQKDVQASIGKEVVVNGFRDLACDRSIRGVIGQTSKLVKQCKSGLLQVEYAGKFYTVPMFNVDLKTDS